MTKPVDKNASAAALRAKAEEVQKTSHRFRKSHVLSEAEQLKLVHELEVHQIELEMQNEELLRAKTQAEIAAKKYAALYDFAPSGYFTLSKAGAISELNLTGSKMLGKERSHLIKSSFRFFVSSDTRQIFDLFLGKVFAGFTAETCEVTLSVSGSPPLDVYLTGIVSENGEQCHLTVMDITALKQSEASLLATKERYKSLFFKAGEGIFILSADARLVEVNESFARMHGYTVEEMLKMSLQDLDTPETGKRAPERMRKILEGETITFEVEHYHKDGHIFPLEVSASLITHDGESFIQCFHRDITDRLLIEQAINIYNEQLKKANAEKDKFFSIVAHDLRSPFQTLLGFTRMLAEDLPTLTLDEVQMIAASMKTSANKLFNLLENLLEWSWIQRGLISFNPQSFLLVKRIAAIAELVRDTANQKMISISYDIPEEMTVLADVQMLETVIRNLVFNAVKFTPRGGKVSIEAKPVPGAFVEISIKDTGIGINEDMINHLFQLDADTSRQGTEGESSTGLGLIICKDLIEQNGGKIWVESEDLKGSAFYFTIPQGNRESEK